MHIVLVDDQEDIRDIMSMMIEDYFEDSHVFCFSKTQDASDYIENCKTDVSLIISDYQLIGETGLHLYNKLESHNIPFFLMTGMVFEEDNVEVNEFTKRSNNRVLYKPLNEEDLVQAIKSVL